MSVIYSVRRPAWLSLVFVLASAPLFSQTNLGRITGSVRDQSGGAMVGVSVSVTDADRGLERSAVTDAAGQYAFPGLLPGRKTIKAEAQGFKAFEQSGVVLEVAQDARLDIVMQPGAVNETVRVTEAPPLLDTTSAELGGTIQNQVINDLPLNGRNFENLLDLRPGVTKYPGNSGWTQSTNGMRPHDNYFMVDGINSNDPWMAQSVMNAVMAAGDAGTILPIDAIDEFKTQQNPRAEFGWKPGAVVNVGVKSGTNGLHGTAYAYGRDGSWDALNYWTQPGDPMADLSLEQFGGSLGGPIRKDKIFFFGNFEEQRYSVGNPVRHSVPITAAGATSATQSLVGACNAARTAGTLTGLSAQIAGLSLTCAPLSNYPGLFPVNNGSTTALGTSIPSENKIDSGLGKIDYHVNGKNSISGMYFISPGNGVFADNPTLQIAGPWLTDQYARSQVGSGNWIFTPTSSVVNSLRVGYSHYYQTFFSVDASQNPANYNYNGSTYHIYTGQTNPSYYGLPLMNFQGGFSFQLGLGWPKTVGPDGVWQIADSVSVLRGNHTFKFGGEILINQSTNNVTANTKGNPRFSSLQNFFAGNPNRVRFTAGDFLRHLGNQGYGLFAQDDWHLTRNVTVNLGLRYELNTVVKEGNNLLGNFDPNQGLVQVGKQIGSVFNGDHNNFAPRFGIAWDVFGNGRTVLRAGAGVFFEQASYDSFMALGNLLGLRTVPTGVSLYTNGNATPTTAGGTINLGAITLTGGAVGSQTAVGTYRYNWANNSSSTPWFSGGAACGDGTVKLATGLTPGPCVTLGVDPNLRTPYVSTWNLGVQQALTNNLSLDVAYVGNHATKLMGLTDLNQPQLVNGFSPGWGNPATPGSPANQCLASAATGYDNCNPDSAAEQAARPFAKKFPYLSYIYWLSNNNFSNYDGLQVSATQRTSHGLSFVLGYTFSHALGMSPDNWSFLNPINSNDVRKLYGSTPFDIRHRFTLSWTYLIPGIKTPGQLLQGWSINSIVTVQSSLPWGVNDTSTDFSGTGEIGNQSTIGEQWNFYGNPSDFKTTKNFINTNDGGGGIPYFEGTSNKACLAKAQGLGPLAVASLANLGCYANGNSILIPPAFGSYGTTGPNIFRSLPYTNVDFSVTKAWQFKERFKAQFRAEFFNVLNHPNISNVFGGPGGDNTFTDPTANSPFGLRPETPDVTSSNPVLGSGGPRAIQLGLKIIF
jgi:Carboxypeptidase regulatory-like domain